MKAYRKIRTASCERPKILLEEDLKSEDLPSTEPQTSPEEWYDHFSNLNTLNEKSNARDDQISECLAQEERLKIFSI